MKDQIVLDQRESSGAIDTWNEFLCISKESDDEIFLSIKVRKIIDSVYQGEILSKYQIPLSDDPEEEEYEYPSVWPEIIEGEQFHSFDGDFLLLNHQDI